MKVFASHHLDRNKDFEGGIQRGRGQGTYNVSLLVVVGRTAGQRCAGDQKRCGRGQECGKDDEKKEEAEAARAHVGNGERRPVVGGGERGGMK